MANRKQGGKPTLGTAMGAFLEQWKATKSSDEADVQPDADVGREDVLKATAKEAFRAWKREHTVAGQPLRAQAAPAPRSHKSAGKTGNTKKPKARSQHAPVRTTAPRLPTTATRSASANPPPAPKSLRERLLEASADIHSLRIHAATSLARADITQAPIVESIDGERIVLGLDFGTAFTKAMVRWKGRHYPVDWSGVVQSDDPFLMASVFSESPDGRCVLGVRDDWRVHEGIKMRLLSARGIASLEDCSNAAVFIALAMRHVQSWLPGIAPDADRGLRWTTQMGLPARSWNDAGVTKAFESVVQAGRMLASRDGHVTRADALTLLETRDSLKRTGVNVLPEFACQLYSYLNSPERSDDLHVLVDIGAGTLDIAYFNVFRKDDDWLLPIFSSEVEPLGAHHLIAALAGAENRQEWHDHDSSLEDGVVAKKLHVSTEAIAKRRSLYLSSVAEVFNNATAEAKRIYPTSGAFRRTNRVRLFVCGGGSRIPTLYQRFERIARESEARMGIHYAVSELIKPRNVVGTLPSGFDRLSVAYGLSQLAANIGNVIRSATFEPMLPHVRQMEKHRDDDR